MQDFTRNRDESAPFVKDRGIVDDITCVLLLGSAVLFANPAKLAEFGI